MIRNLYKNWSAEFDISDLKQCDKYIIFSIMMVTLFLSGLSAERQRQCVQGVCDAEASAHTPLLSVQQVCA